MIRAAKRRNCFIAILLALLYSCSSDPEIIEVNPEFGKYISGYTSGVISVADPVRIILADPYQGSLNFSAPLPDDVFSFNPDVAGKAVWINQQTIEFRPAQNLNSGTVYQVDFELGDVISAESGFETFSFSFQTIHQNLTLFALGYSAIEQEDLTRIRYSGTVHTADKATIADLEKIFVAKQLNEEKSISWTSSGPDQFSFTINDVQRGESKGEILLTWNGKPVGWEFSGEKRIEIPALGEFSVINTHITHQPEQVITLYFSDPIMEQDLLGLIFIEHSPALTFSIDGNTIKIFPGQRIEGNKLLTVSSGIRNTAGHNLPKPFSQTVIFEQEKPEIRINDRKTIMPAGTQLVLPFEAVSLKAVDVYITKVFSNNILQFFQQNELGDNYQITYVGRHIYRKHIDLRSQAGGNLYQWNKFYVDLAEVVKPDPGAIYQVELRFKPEYAAYPCDKLNSGSLPNTDINKDQWHTGDEYFIDDYWNDYQYDWDHMDNPCHRAYYAPYRTRNAVTVMATDMGITAKMGGNHEMLVVVNNLQSTKPVQNARITVYDLQQQIIETGKTNRDGFAVINLKRKPFVVMAESGNNKSYLKVEEYNALSLSKFEVGGASVQDGVKGFIYAERGVWRPGDSIYLNLVIHDELKLLPENHPVKLELTNPRGQITEQIIRTSHFNGFYDFRTATRESDPTGSYLANFSIGNRRFSKYLKIETVKPNRLKIDFDFGKELISGTRVIRTQLGARWLHGAVASGLRADVSLTISPSKTSFEGWSGFQFDNELSYNGDSEPVKIFDGQLGVDGNQQISADLSDRMSNAPGIMKLSFQTKVFEPGGGFSEDFHSVKYSPYESYTGIRVPEGNLWGNALETDREHQIELAVVNASGKTVNRKNILITLYKINERWWYDSYEGNSFNFQQSSSYREVKRESITLKDGKAAYNLNIPQDEWGRYVLVADDPVSGHSAAQFIFFDWPYWMRANRTDTEASTILGFSSDKETYLPGEKIKLTFPSPDNGRALICIENGTRILDKYWIETTKGETKTEIEVTPEMAPNVFAHISLIQPHSQTNNDRPIRLFGVIPLGVENPGTKLNPVIVSPEVLRPESEVLFTVSEANGKPMTYTLSIVDEGLLDLTRFKTPDPHQAIYAREALGVRTWDLYDQVIGAIGQINGSMLQTGGDEDAIDPGKQKAMRFKPMVRHLGPFSLKAGEKANHKINIPNYIGSVRAMVVAGDQPAYGNAEKAIPVRTPLMVLGTLPRVLGPDEEVLLPVNVFAMEPQVKNVSVRVTTNNLLSMGGPSEQNIRFNSTGDSLLMFKLKVARSTGMAKVKIEASSGGERSVHNIEIDVRSPNPVISVVKDTVIFEGTTWNTTTEFFGAAGSNKAMLELSTLPALNLEKRLNYLINYPHGCLEQITSSAFAQIHLGQLVALNSEQQQSVSAHLNEVLRNYLKYQLNSGGLSHWPGQFEVNEWSHSYAGHLMLLAEMNGYALPPGLKPQWLRYQQNKARSWGAYHFDGKGHEERIQAYRLYTLALADAPDIGAMNLLKTRNNLNESARWILALAYAEAGQTEVTDNLILNLNTSVSDYTELNYTFGSSTRDEAFVLMTLLKLNRKTEAAKVAESIARKLGKENWYSTQTTAFAIAAVAAFTGKQSGNAGLKANVSIDGAAQSIATGRQVVQIPVKSGKNQTAITVKSETTLPVFARVITSGRPIDDQTPAMAKNLKMDIRYFGKNGELTNPSLLPFGSDFTIEIEITNPGVRGDYKELALTHVLPSGWEILNQRLSEESDDSEQSAAVYQDIRDDRVYTYFNLARNRSFIYRIKANASYAGRFFMPAIHCGAMYDHDISAVTSGKWIEVKR